MTGLDGDCRHGVLTKPPRIDSRSPNKHNHGGNSKVLAVWQIGIALHHARYQQNGGGEDILLNAEIVCKGIRIPKERSWYTLEGEFLGTDVLTGSQPFE